MAETYFYSMYFTILLLFLSVVIPMMLEQVYSETDDFRFAELDESYSLGDKISIKFEKITMQPCPSYEVSMMKIGFPDSVMNYGVEPLCAIPGPVNPYLFSEEFEKSEFFDSVGTYVIKVKLDNETIQREIKITDNELMENKFGSYFSIHQKQVRYVIPYQISGGTVQDMQLGCDPPTLTVSISSNDSGILEMEIPNAMMRSIFSILVDGQEWDDVSIDGNTLTVIFPKFSNIIEINSAYLLTHDKNRDGACDIVHDPPHSFIVSPLKQFNSGISINEIQCKENLNLLQKHDGSPACVKPETVQELANRGWAKDYSTLSQINTSCMTIEQSRQVASFFKIPKYLPEGYLHVCSRSGMPFESYIVYHSQEFPNNWQIHELVNDGAIFIYQVDERNMVDEEKYATLGTAEQRIQSTYDSVMESNPSLQPQLIRINGMLAYAVDSCPDCGMQTASFPDGTVIQKSTSTETKIKFIDGDGITYMLKTTLPLDELIRVAESLQ